MPAWRPAPASVPTAVAASEPATAEPAPATAKATHTELDALLGVVISASLPERKDALEELAALVRARPDELEPVLEARLRLQPASVRLPLGRLLGRRGVRTPV